MPLQCTVLYSLVSSTFLAARHTRMEVGDFSGGLKSYEIPADKLAISFLHISLSMH